MNIWSVTFVSNNSNKVRLFRSAADTEKGLRLDLHPAIAAKVTSIEFVGAE